MTKIRIIKPPVYLICHKFGTILAPFLKTDVLKFPIYVLLLLVWGWCPAQTEISDSTRKTADSIQNNDKDSLRAHQSFIKIDSGLLAKRHAYVERVGNWKSMDSIQLNKVFIIAPLHFDNRKERRKYLILRRKVKRVWPYAILAAERLTSLNERLDQIDSRYGKSRYTKRVQRYLESKFKERLKKLSKTEGQILVKLLYRQTGETSYELVRDLRNGWRAFRYNVTAHLFTISLKEKYDPYQVKEDYYIEHILLRGFQHHELEHQNPAIELNYSKIINNWNQKSVLN